MYLCTSVQYDNMITASRRDGWMDRGILDTIDGWIGSVWIATHADGAGGVEPR